DGAPGTYRVSGSEDAGARVDPLRPTREAGTFTGSARAVGNSLAFGRLYHRWRCMAANVVWVLGAGFSVSLGGPTLKTLLSKASGGNLLASFPECGALKGSEAEFTRHLYAYGRRFPEGPFSNALQDGEDLWPDPEAFLDYLDTAICGGAESPH